MSWATLGPALRLLVKDLRVDRRFRGWSSGWVDWQRCTHSTADRDRAVSNSKEGEDASEAPPKGAGRKKCGMKIMKRLGMTPAAQSLMMGYSRPKKKEKKSQPAEQDQKKQRHAIEEESVERIVQGLLAGEEILDCDYLGKGQPVSKELLMSMLEQLDAVESKNEDLAAELDPVLDSDDPSIDYVNVVSEIRTLSRGKTSVKWLGKRKPVSKKEMEGVDCSRDYDFHRGAFESPDQAKFKKPLDDESG